MPGRDWNPEAALRNVNSPSRHRVALTCRSLQKRSTIENNCPPGGGDWRKALCRRAEAYCRARLLSDGPMGPGERELTHFSGQNQSQDSNHFCFGEPGCRCPLFASPKCAAKASRLTRDVGVELYSDVALASATWSSPAQLFARSPRQAFGEGLRWKDGVSDSCETARNRDFVTYYLPALCVTFL